MVARRMAARLWADSLPNYSLIYAQAHGGQKTSQSIARSIARPWRPDHCLIYDQSIAASPTVARPTAARLWTDLQPDQLLDYCGQTHEPHGGQRYDSPIYGDLIQSRWAAMDLIVFVFF